jgi:hypothetical protein
LAGLAGFFSFTGLSFAKAHFPRIVDTLAREIRIEKETNNLGFKRTRHEKEIYKKMEWTRTETLALAVQSCVLCNGLGLRTSEKSEETQPCSCVLRNVFRACYARFRDCLKKEKFISKVSLESIQGCDGSGIWSRKDEEYIADFTLVSRRALTEQEYAAFKFHYLLGADWRLCCSKLKIDRAMFFRMVYKIEYKLGRVYRELEPYALYPLNEYFSGPTGIATAPRFKIEKIVPIRPPLRQTRQTPAPSPPVQRAA